MSTVTLHSPWDLRKIITCLRAREKNFLFQRLRVGANWDHARETLSTTPRKCVMLGRESKLPQFLPESFSFFFSFPSFSFICPYDHSACFTVLSTVLY